MRILALILALTIPFALPPQRGAAAPHVARCRGDVLTSRQRAVLFLHGGSFVCEHGRNGGWVYRPA